MLVDGHDGFPDWRGFVHVDDAGGLRLFDSFEKAVSGEKDQALELETPSSTKNVLIKTRALDYDCLASVKGFEITTSRNQVDTTVLGQEHKNLFEAGLISGQGDLTCFWEHERGMCDDRDKNTEFPIYLARLILRLQQGSDFLGRFFIYWGGKTESSIWYEAECIVTNVAVTVAPTQLIETKIQFVTSGPVTRNLAFHRPTCCRKTKTSSCLSRPAEFCWKTLIKLRGARLGVAFYLWLISRLRSSAS